MKMLGLSLILVVLSGTSFLLGQSEQGQSKEDAISALTQLNSQILHAQSSGVNPFDGTLFNGTKIDSGSLLVPDDDRDNTCAFMRTYRMKREARGSDTTRPAGYTVCVPTRRFAMKSTVLEMK